MVATLIALGLATAQSATVAGPFEMGERLRILDAAWIETTDKSLRGQAAEHLKKGTFAFFAAQYSDACRALDLATAALHGGTPKPESAINARFIPPVIEPGGQANLHVTWAYLPGDGKAVTIRVSSRTITLQPGRSVDILVNPTAINPDLRLTPEIGYAVAFTAGSEPRTAYLSIVKNAKSRIEALARSKDPTAKALGAEMRRTLLRPEGRDDDLPFLDWMLIGERLAAGRLTPAQAEALPYVVHNGTVFRAQFPKNGQKAATSGGITVVLAFHGVGGSGDLFFDAYGRGSAVEEAEKRGWAFISCNLNSTAVRDVLAWLRDVKKVAIKRLFVMGHGSGAGMAMTASAEAVRPSAAALFAPALTSFLREWATVPIYLAVGKQEIPRMLNSARSLNLEFASRPDFSYTEFDPCDHMMVVADGIPAAYAFFDKYAK